jgi:hypothetical protein
VGGCVAVRGGGRRLAVAGVRCGWVGRDRCCWFGCRRLASVGFIGWWLLAAGIDLVWVWCGGIVLSIQYLVCDGGCWVAAEGDPVGGCGGVWQG